MPVAQLAALDMGGKHHACGSGAGQNVASRQHVEELLKDCCLSPVDMYSQACAEALAKLQSQHVRHGEMHSSK